MSHSIVPTAESHFESLYHAFDAVARERKYLAFTEAPPWEQSGAFYRNVLANDFPHFVALQDDAVVGWCDVAPVFGHSRAHIGMLGIALLPQARHLGLGKRLMQAAIAKAWARGLTRIELTVRADNLNAKALYESFGFEPEGVHRRGSCIDGEYHDVWGMALLR
mgnify:FL=1